MSKVTFKYNIKKDAWSWVLIAKSKSKGMFGLNWRKQVIHIPEDLLSKILELDFSKAQDMTEEYLKTHPKRKYREAMINQELIVLENIWRTVEKNFFNILSDITQRPVYRNNFKCFLTTGFMCPYNKRENWFMVSIWCSLPFSLTITCHELLHFQFLHYYKGYLKKKGLKEKQIENLKESLTFLLNEPEFEEIILVKDKGYPQHRALRKKLRRIWQKDKNFIKFLDKSIIEISKDKNLQK